LNRLSITLPIKYLQKVNNNRASVSEKYKNFLENILGFKYEALPPKIARGKRPPHAYTFDTAAANYGCLMVGA
jgi:hypothetical protein